MAPGTAEGTHTSVRWDEMPLIGEVGLREDDGCHMVLRTKDRVGNVCDRGGSIVTTTTSAGAEMQSTCTDQGDGTYAISWRSKLAGSFEIKILINKANVRNSPFRLDLISTRPELPKTQMGGDGLTSAIAGVPTPIVLHLVDEFGNPARPGPLWQVGVAIGSSKQKSTLPLTLPLTSTPDPTPDLYPWPYP